MLNSRMLNFFQELPNEPNREHRRVWSSHLYVLVVFLAAAILRDLLVELVRVGNEAVRDPVALVASLVLAEVEAAAELVICI